VCSGDENPASCCTVTRPKARKQHWCCECGESIPIGTVYVNTSGIWDGNADRFKQHVECHDLLDEISKTMCGGEPWAFTQLQYELAEYREWPPAVRLLAKFEAIKAKYAEVTRE